jgi:hypothetical protein
MRGGGCPAPDTNAPVLLPNGEPGLRLNFRNAAGSGAELSQRGGGLHHRAGHEGDRQD